MSKRARCEAPGARTLEGVDAAGDACDSEDLSDGDLEAEDAPDASHAHTPAVDDLSDGDLSDGDLGDGDLSDGDLEAEDAPAASPARDPEDADEQWAKHFFDEENIVHSLQSLLRNGGHAIDDLCKLCIDASASDIVAALTPEGLMPFSNNYGYVFKYEHMTKSQIRALVKVIDAMATQNRMMRCVHENNFYVVPLNKNFVKIRDEVLLFGAASFICSELAHTSARPDGSIVTERVPDGERERIINAAIFRIVNSCAMKRGALSECMQMLHARNIRI
jgi:hypothetical protein